LLFFSSEEGLSHIQSGLEVVQVATPTGITVTGVQLNSEQLVAISIIRAGDSMLDSFLSLFTVNDIKVGKILIQRDEETALPHLMYYKVPDLTGKQVILLDPMLATGFLLFFFFFRFIQFFLLFLLRCLSFFSWLWLVCISLFASFLNFVFAFLSFSNFSTAKEAIKVLLNKGYLYCFVSLLCLIVFRAIEERITFFNVVSCPEGLRSLSDAYPKVKIITGHVDEGLNEKVKPLSVVFYLVFLFCRFFLVSGVYCPWFRWVPVIFLFFPSLLFSSLRCLFAFR
jgi:uracil phosphoribosyltransferase